jgi:hypothetical protein
LLCLHMLLVILLLLLLLTDWLAPIYSSNVCI